MSKFIDITGKTFGNLTVIERLPNEKGGVVRWKCRCSCGKYTTVRSSNLKSGLVKSCGCLKHIAPNKTHGASKTRLYRIYASIKDRCYNPHAVAFHRYGGRGITMCEEWHKFENFRRWALENGYRDGLTIERKNVDRNYEPDNCEWITLSQQAMNRSSNLKFTHNGKTQILSEWVKELGLSYSLIHNRIYRLGWDFERAISTPSDVKKRKRR